MSESCPVCCSRQTGVEKTIGKYTVLKCRDCLLFWVPGVSDAELAGFYGSSYFSGSQEFGYGDYLATETVQRLNARQLIRIIAAHLRTSGSLPNINLLDVGCAYGFLVDEACLAGARAQGIDQSEEACHYAVSHLRRHVTLGSLHSANLPQGYFDAVTSIGSIEHLNNPVAMVEETARIIKREGLFVITTVDTKAFIRIYRFKPPEHLYYFSRHNIALLLAAKGFVVESVTSYSSYHLLGEAIGLLSKALFGSRVSIEYFLQRMPLRNAGLKLPNNEMLVIARRR